MLRPEQESHEEIHLPTLALTSQLRNIEMLLTSKRTTFLVTLRNLQQKREVSSLGQDFGRYSRADKTRKKFLMTRWFLVILKILAVGDLLDTQGQNLYR
jgi:hypothetical protein